MSGEPPSLDPLPESVLLTLEDFRTRLDLDVRLWSTAGGGRARLYPQPSSDGPEEPTGDGIRRTLEPRDAPPVELEVRPVGEGAGALEGLADVLAVTLERAFDAAREIRFFTYELSERYEEINLLYSISETLGSVLHLEEAARNILLEVCDVMGARRGSLWVWDPGDEVLRLTAFVGERGLEGPLKLDDPNAVSPRVFREGRPLIVNRARPGGPEDEAEEEDSFLSVPIRYTPPTGDAKTVGVLNLIGRRRGGRFTASDQKLLSAIASQVGAALENNRLIQESLAQERMTREMELAQSLQTKLLPALDTFEHANVAARVEPALEVGGDFYHLFKLSKGRVGLMIGDVSGHGFPAALIMALSMSAASIYATEVGSPAMVLRQLDDALREELESTETYLTVFYAVIDPKAGKLVYSNAGHPHAFIVHADGTHARLKATDPPVGIAGPGSFGQTVIPWAPARDLLFLFTDGLSDTLATDTLVSGESLVVEEVIRRRTEAPGAIVEGLLDLARERTPSIPADDRTAIALRL